MKCWNCGSKMQSKIDVNGHPYELCPKCKASHCDAVTLGYDPLAAHKSYLKNDTGSVLARIRHPSKSVSRQATKARSKKLVD